MKALPYAILALLSLLLEVGAQTLTSNTSAVEDGQDKLLSHAAASATEPGTTSEADSSADAGTTLFIADTLKLPVMRDQLTITESAQALSVDIEDLHFSYGKKMQEFAATLDDDTAGFSINKQSQKRQQLLNILVVFIIEVAITLIVLKITFLVGEFRYCFYQVLPISLAVAFVGALLHITLGISLLNPMQIALSSLIMLMLIRFITEAHEWAVALQITFVARLVAIGLIWLAFTGMSVFGFYI
ncbi:MAG: hypothetical protein ABS34_08155 [Opitutaceae bacterium BACL24 MAG-120322-bin51]|jgi:hypothetical protein|nr:MAG: hypothetical protein ABS34_08155 [Opitutaceae bacterium BACL24 MAG-120322-bin51]